jgi:uncharacterized membrane protein YagU involved in acid resistance
MTSNTARTVAGGLAGTLVMTGMLYGVAPMMGVHMDIAEMLGSLLGGSWMAGLVMHLVNGTVIFPLIFGLLLQQRLPGSAAVRGVVFGLGLWLVAQVMVMPMMGAGFFSANAGGAMAAMGSFVAHALYGAVLGTVSGVAPRVPARA